MRHTSQVFIFIDLEKAMNAGIEFFLSMNGVVLTKGDENGFLAPSFFSRVEREDRQPIKGWEGVGPIHAAQDLLEAKVDASVPTDNPSDATVDRT